MITPHDACLTCRVSKTNKVRFDSDSLNLYWFSVAEVLREFISLILTPRKKKLRFYFYSHKRHFLAKPTERQWECISLIKSKSGFLIRKGIFRFFTNIQNGLLMHNKGEFFKSYPKPDTLDTWSEAFLYYTRIRKKEYCHRLLETILIHTSAVWLHCSSLRPFFNPRHGLNDQFYPLYRSGKIA